MPRKRRRAARGSRPAKVTPLKRGPKKSWTWRAQVFDPLASDGQGAYVSACAALRLPPQTFGSEAEAWEHVDRAEAVLVKRGGSQTTVAQIAAGWLARERDARAHKLAASTTITNAERVGKFVQHFADEHPAAVEERMLAHARTLSPPYRAACKAMFNWAVGEALLAENPLRRLAINKSKGNAEVFPPTETQHARLLRVAREVLPAYADWIQFGALVGLRPGETDALRFSDFSADLSKVQILRQYNIKTRSITHTKKVRPHWIAVPPEARMIVRRQMKAIDNPDGYVFLNTRGEHWTTNSRAYYWNAVMVAAGFRRREGAELVSDFTTNLATRHYAGWYMVNVLRLPSEEVAHQLRHDDHGELVRKLYGKRDRAAAIDAVGQAWEDAA
jgi:integrase